MTFSERLVQLRKDAGFLKRNEFAEALGIPSTTLRNYETGVREPGHIFIKQVSNFFNISCDYLLCLTDDKKVLNAFNVTDDEKNLIQKYRTLDESGRNTVDVILNIQFDRCESQNKEYGIDDLNEDSKIIDEFNVCACNKKAD